MADKQLERFRKHYVRLKSEIGKLGFISPGSIVARDPVCGKPTCKCQADPPQPHPRCLQWSRKLGGTTVSRRLKTASEEHLFREWKANFDKLNRLIEEMDDVSRAAAEVLLSRAE